MIITPQEYFEFHDLYDRTKLLTHCEQNFVRVSEADMFPGLVLLHYSDEAAYEKKWNNFNRMCRGLIVDLYSKKIVAYPHDKFFNVGEVEETNYTRLQQLGQFEVSEKLDGSLLILFQDPRTKLFFFTTKGSFTSEHGKYATELITADLKNAILVSDYTLMFELISKKFQIVIDYVRTGYAEGIYLIGARDRKTNKLLSYKEVQELAKQLNVPAIQTYVFPSLDNVVEKTSELHATEEGYVLHFTETNEFVKLKGKEYLQLHKFISKMSPKYVLEACAEGLLSKLLEIAPEEYRDEIQRLSEHFISEVKNLEDTCSNYFEDAPKTTRKEFALWVLQNVEESLRGQLFKLFDKKPLDKPTLFYLVGDLEKVSGAVKI